MTAWEDIVTAEFTATRIDPRADDRAGLLRAALRADALATGLAGPVLIAGAPALDDWLGVPAALLVVLGVLFVGWLAGLWALAARPHPRRALVRVVIGANLAWVVASVLVIATDALSLTTAGTVVVALLAAAVAVFADLQLLGLRRVARARA